MGLNAADIFAAQQGDADAMHRLLEYYDHYLTSLSFVTIKTEGGGVERVFSSEIKEDLQAAVIEATLKFDIDRILKNAKK